MKKVTIPLENKAGAITFIPVANVVFYFTSLFTTKGKKLAVYIETVVLLIIGSLLLHLSLGWVMNAVCAYVLSVVGVIIEQQLLQDAPLVHNKKSSCCTLFCCLRYSCCLWSHRCLRGEIRRKKCSQFARIC